MSKEDVVLLVNLVLLGLALVMFGLSFLESVWFSLTRQRVIAWENSHGGSTFASKTARTLLRQRMVVVGFIEFTFLVLFYYGTRLLDYLFEGNDSILALELAVFPFLSFFLAEFLPKYIGYQRRVSGGLASAVPLYIVLKPFLPILGWMYRIAGGEELAMLGEADVIATAQAAQADGALDPAEADLIKRALGAGNRRVGDFMVPLKRCPVVSLQPTLEEVEAAIQGPRVDALVVVKEQNTVSGVVGIHDLSQMLLSHLSKGDPKTARVDLSGKVMPTVDLVGSKFMAEALGVFGNNPVCVVTDNQGNDLGIITRQSISETLFKGVER